MSVKCVLVGDSAVGKTALLVRFTSETFPDTYKPTVFDNTGVEVYMDGVQISLGLWDTAGNDNLRQVRPRSYQQADVVLICYSVANPNSLASVQHKWIAEVRENLPKVPVLVVATQTDLREIGAYRGSCISAAEGRRVAQEVHAKGYLECSSLNNRGVQQVFECAVRTAVNQYKKQARRRMFSINQCKVFWPLTWTFPCLSRMRTCSWLSVGDLIRTKINQFKYVFCDKFVTFYQRVKQKSFCYNKTTGSVMSSESGRWGKDNNTFSVNYYIRSFL